MVDQEMIINYVDSEGDNLLFRFANVVSMMFLYYEILFSTFENTTLMFAIISVK